ncbi:MAG: ornithine cyclodeaminase family protein [Gammaproteobacteria bacterium]|nr:ornithine cyclodeaminase family protein [Gammaproteobacteria bacterium]
MSDTLLITNRDMPGLATTAEYIEVIERAYLEHGQGVAQELPRRRIYHPRAEPPDHYYWFNEMAGVVPGMRSMGLRVNSATVNVARKRGNARLGFPGAFSALIFLFDTESNELLAILRDFFINPLRVAATSAIVSRRLARDDSKVMGLFGSGTQALLQVQCHLAVMDLDEIRVYSTRKERRENVAVQITEATGVRAVAVDNPREAVAGCDIVTTATSSNEPVFDGAWLEKGTHVNTMIGSDYFLPRRETDDETVLSSDIIVVNSRESVRLDKQPELYPHLMRGTLSWDDIYEIGELLVRRRLHGRSTSEQITYHNNNVGMGIQFAAVGRLIYERALERGVGHRVDSRFFMQYDDDLRAIRDTAFLGKAPEGGAARAAGE